MNHAIIRKIQKLLEVARSQQDRPGYENEAALAMQKVQTLLAEQNLDLATVLQTSVEGGVQQTVEEVRDQVAMQRYGARFVWQRELWKAVSEAHFCDYWTESTTMREPPSWDKIYRKRHIILGRQSNVIVAQMMGAYLCDSIERLLPFQGVERNSREAVSWRKGAADRIIDRLRVNIEKMKSKSRKDAPAGSTALVLADVFQRERIANYDARRGEGAWARRQARQVEWDQQRAQAEQERAEERRLANEEWQRRLEAETPKEREARLRRQEKENEKLRAKHYRDMRTYDRQQWREDSKTDWHSYNQGREAGKGISLSKQAGEARAPRRIKGA